MTGDDVTFADRLELLRLLAIYTTWPTAGGPGAIGHEFGSRLNVLRAIERLGGEMFRPKLTISKIPHPPFDTVEKAVEWYVGEYFEGMKVVGDFMSGPDEDRPRNGWLARVSLGDDEDLVTIYGLVEEDGKYRTLHHDNDPPKTHTVELTRCNGCGDNVFTVELVHEGQSYCSTCVHKGRHEWPGRWREEFKDARLLCGLGEDLADIELDDDEGTGIASEVQRISGSMAVRFERKRMFIGEARAALELAETKAEAEGILNELMDHL